jgi:RHS repeat-associated protein
MTRTAFGIRARVPQAAASGLVVAALLVVGSTRAHAQQQVVEYYATDALGSIRVVFNGSGTVVARSDYLPFGEAWAQAGNLPEQRFTGQQRDSAEGLDYFNARSLQVRTGRFARVDPVFAGLFNPQGWSRYTYALNNPLSFVDPSGTEPTFRVWVDGRYPRQRGPGGYGEPVPIDTEKPPPTRCGILTGREHCSGITRELIDPTVTVTDPDGGNPDGGPDGQVVTTTPDEKKKRDPCNVVDGPKGESLDRNIAEARKHPIVTWVLVPDPRVGSMPVMHADAVQWFKTMMRDYSPWDYKRRSGTPEEKLRYERFGNINYGATGRAVGFEAVTLLAGSLHGHLTKHGVGGLTRDQLANETGDWSDIMIGVSYHDAGCKGKE